MVKRIGVLTIDIESSYSEMLWSYLSKAIENTEFDLVVLPCYNPEFPFGYRYQNNVLLNFIHKKNIDVLIFMPELLSNFISKEKTEALIKRIRHNVPVVSLNLILKNAPSLIIDNTTGIKKAVQHLICDHHYKKIGFMCGPKDNSEARERKEAYINALKAQNIIPEKNWFFPGDFTPESARLLALTQGDNIVKNFDAVLCANDEMAIGFTDILQRNNYSIPKDLAIVGFDNLTKAPFQNPPLTTIKQPFKEMIVKAVQLAIDICNGKNPSDVIHFKSELIIRNTCGCENLSCEIINGEDSFEEGIDATSVKEAIKKECIKFPDQNSAQRIDSSIDNLLNSLSKNDPTNDDAYNFLILLESFINEELYTFNSFPDWQKVVSLLLTGYSKIDNENYQAWKAHNLLGKLMLLVNKKEKIWCGYNEAKRLEYFTFPLRSLQQNMSTVLTREEMLKVVVDELSNIGIKNCYISLLLSGTKRRGLYSTVEEESDLILSYKDGQIITEAERDHSPKFKTLDLLPAGSLKQSSGNSWFVAPLYNKAQLFGFIVSDCKDYSGAVFESLRHQLSITLYSCYLNDERIKAETKLRDVMLDLEKANRQLKIDSMYDEMTSLLNRRGFINKATLRIQENTLNPIQFCLFFADMDGLKKINDTLGHASGDTAIIDMADILKRIFREEDIIARLGGDEFTILTVDVPKEFPLIIQERLTNLLDDYNNVERDFILSISIGYIINYTNESLEDLPTLMDKADKMLYENKKEKSDST